MAITFTIWFRLECFTVYALLLLLPSAAQDSLYSEVASPSITEFSPVRLIYLILTHLEFMRQHEEFNN
ncbi:hypothetical protein OTSUT76_2524 [Orientia tsutsugamushi str. UT76]|nr:hypothetical protein OTSUT76_2524 [Orientia tsutsugamushi str. UT76]